MDPRDLPFQSRETAMIGSTVGNFRITTRIGAGGMGEVFLAQDVRLERQAAIKFLPADMAGDPERRQRFLREARAASALSHPNVCVVYDVGEADDGRPFLAMEYIDGDTLEGFVRHQTPSAAQVVDIAFQVADALDAAHGRGIVHRDIKPANITRSQRGQVKVLDFGLAKWTAAPPNADGATSELRQTQEGTVLGTPAFMSPEQAMGRVVDQRSDLFSLGSVIYFLLTGREPFSGSTIGDMINSLLHCQPDAIARFNYDVPAELERITLKLLAKDADRRYQSARDLMVDLKNLHRELLFEPERSARLPNGSPNHVSSRLGREAEEALTRTGISQSASTVITDPEQIASSDVVITYANLDDVPAASARQGWISQLHQNLQVRVAQLSGKRVAVVKQPDTVSSELEAEILRQLPKAKTVVSVLSPPFAKSDGCRRIVETFWKKAHESGSLEVNHRSRLLNVIKTPVDDDELPPDIRSVYTGLVPYEFFERDPTSGRLREFDEVFGEAAIQRFHERVYDVAYDISQVLKYLGEAPETTSQRTANPRTIFLAATTSDLEPQRDQLRRELTELGHEVLPKHPLPLVASELIAAVENCLQRADLAIHFVGEHFGLVPEATDLSVVALQNQVAARYCDDSSLRRLIWIPKGLQPRDERQASFLRQLQSEPQSITGAELIADTLENLKVLLRSRWERPSSERKIAESSRNGDAAPRVYLICDQQDEQAVEPIEDYFYEQGIEVSLTAFEADESEVQQIHIQNLRDCDGAVVYYGAAGMHWVDFKLRDLQKAVGYRDAKPIPVTAVLLAPPFNRRKERFKSLSTDVIRQDKEQFHPQLLSDFVACLRQARENV